MNTGNESASISANPAVPQVKLDGPTSVALLQADNERLQQRIRQLEQERDRDRQVLQQLQVERDAYLRAVHAWALEQITDEDLRRYAQPEAGMPFEDVVAELEGASEGKDT